MKHKYIFKVKVEDKKHPRRLQCGSFDYKACAPIQCDLSKIDLVREYTANILGCGMWTTCFTTNTHITPEQYRAGQEKLIDFLRRADVVIKHYGNTYYVHMANECYVAKRRVELLGCRCNIEYIETRCNKK